MATATARAPRASTQRQTTRVHTPLGTAVRTQKTAMPTPQGAMPSDTASGQDIKLKSPKLLASPAAQALFAEYLIGMLIIFTAVFTETGSGYATRMSKVMWQMTALTGVFFVLALAATYENGTKAVIAFGALIDGGILFTYGRSVVTTLHILGGAGAGVSQDQIDAELAPDVVHTLVQGPVPSLTPPGVIPPLPPAGS